MVTVYVYGSHVWVIFYNLKEREIKNGIMRGWGEGELESVLDSGKRELAIWARVGMLNSARRELSGSSLSNACARSIISVDVMILSSQLCLANGRRRWAEWEYGRSWEWLTDWLRSDKKTEKRTARNQNFLFLFSCVQDQGGPGDLFLYFS